VRRQRSGPAVQALRGRRAFCAGVHRRGTRYSVDGLAEVFNLFNHANYGAFVTNETAANYRAPSFVLNVNYNARIEQLGFRITF
jgi:hypothetical protein